MSRLTRRAVTEDRAVSPGGSHLERASRAIRVKALSLGIRTWLVLLVLVSAIPGGVLLAHQSARHRAVLANDVAADLGQTAALAAQRIGATVERAHGALSALAALANVRALDDARCSEIARGVMRSEPGFSNIALAGPDGRLFCSAVPLAGPIRVDDRGYFRRALESHDLVVGTFAVSRAAGQPVLHVAHPVVDERGVRAGVAVAALDVRHMDRLLAAIASGPAEVLTVVDGQGTVVARHPENSHWVGSTHDAPLVKRMLSAGDGFAEVAGLDGVVRMYAIATVRAANAPTDLRVSVGVERSSALAEVETAFRRSMAVYVVAAAMGLLTAWLLGEFALSRRLERIRAAARRLTAGDLRARSGLVGSADGIGGLARAFDEMAASIEKLTLENRLILECVGVGIYGVDRAGIITFVNPAASELLGYPATELLGTAAHDLLHSSGEPRPAGAGGCALLHTVEDGGVHGSNGALFRRRDGRTLPVDVVSTPARNGGELVGSVVTFADVTERVRLEVQLRHAQKMEAVGRLAGGVAHDFNNLLTVLLSAGHSIAERAARGDAELRADADDVLTAAHRAAALTKRLLAFSRTQPVTLDIVHVSSLVASWQALLVRLLGEHVDTRLSLSATASVRIDSTQLEQVLVNLAVNARDAMPGGGRLTIETADVVLDGAGAQGRLGAPPGRYVMVAVTDTGAGMDEETLLQIFEPFFTTKPVGQGTGLGLSTVWGIVKQTGGDIRVYSASGKGTTFKVYLPALDREGSSTSAAPPPRVALDALRGTETVLLVEDEDRVRRVAAHALRRAGYRVVEARSPGEALRGIEEGMEFDALLTDVIMPELSGPELADRVRRARPSARVVFMSGYTGAALAHQQVLRGDAGFLEKPFTAESLLTALRETLARPVDRA